MNKKIMRISTALVLSGALIAACGFALAGKPAENAVVKNEQIGGFDSVKVDGASSDIVFALSDDGAESVEFTGSGKTECDVSVKDETLTIKLTDMRKWYDLLGSVFSGNEKLTVYLGAREYSKLEIASLSGSVDLPSGLSFADADIRTSSGNADIGAAVSGTLAVRASSGSVKMNGVNVRTLEADASSGNIYASDIAADSASFCTSSGSIKITDAEIGGALSASASSGELSLENVDCGSAVLDASSGSIGLTSVKAESGITGECISGDIRLTACAAPEMDLTTSSGSVKGTVSGDMIYITKTSSGSVTVPDSVKDGGMCRVETISGNIDIKGE